MSPGAPTSPVPEWCRYEPFDPGWPSWRERLYSALHPRGAIARAGWRPPDDFVTIADHVTSSAAVEGLERSVATVHYRAMADAVAVRTFRPGAVQEARAERRAGRLPQVVLAYSERVAQGLFRPAWVVPIAYPVPPAPVAPVDAPVAVLMADWQWPANKMALARLLAMWPAVVSAVPGARLVLAGRGMEKGSLGAMAGVHCLGPVGASADVLSQAAVVAFPCPNTSGPKVKVLEALAHGIPVVTTPAGVEGLVLPEGDGAVVVGLPQFGPALVDVLLSPERRRLLGQSGRAAIESNHSGIASAAARISAIEHAFAGSRSPVTQRSKV